MKNLINDLKSKLMTSQRNAWKLNRREATDKMCWFAAKLIAEKVEPENHHLYLEVSEGFFDFDIISSIIDELKDKPTIEFINEPVAEPIAEFATEKKIFDLNLLSRFGATGKMKKGVLVIKNGAENKKEIIDFLQDYRSALNGFTFA